MKFPSSVALFLMVCASGLAFAQDPTPPASGPTETPAAESGPAGTPAAESAAEPAQPATTPAAAEEAQPAASEASEADSDTQLAAAAPAAPKMGEIDVIALQKLGYKVVNENGTRLFCKKEQVTGTRLRERTRCLTETEAMQTRDNAVEMLNDMSRNRQNFPSSN
jgi:hypothetical protein